MSLGTSELGSASAELGNIELAGLGSAGPNIWTESVTTTFLMTDGVTGTLPSLQQIVQTLTLTDAGFTVGSVDYNTFIEQQYNVAIYNAGAELLTETNAIVTTVQAGIIAANDPYAIITNIALESLGGLGIAYARVTNIAAEVLRLSAVTQIATVSQTLTFSDGAAFGGSAIYFRQLLTSIEYVDSANTVTGSLYNPSITQTLGLSDQVSRNGANQLLHSIIYSQYASASVSSNAPNTLTMNQTISTQFVHGRTIADTLAFTATTAYTHPGRVRDTLAFLQSLNSGKIIASACQSGTLGDNELADMFLGLDCGTGGPNGFVTDTSLVYTSTVKLKKVYNREIVDNLAFSATETLGPWSRSVHINDVLIFAVDDYQKPIALGTGAGTTVTQPVAVGTLVQPHQVTIQSALGAIVLPNPKFDDSVQNNNKLTLTKVLSHKNYVYIKRQSRVQLSYTFQLGRRKSIELRQFFQANVDEFLTLTNWKGEIYYVKFGNDPIELETTGRYEYEYEKVMVDLQFQGVKLSG